MKRHLITHTGEKPFPCNQCLKTISQWDDVKRTHIGEKPIPCNQCLKWFFEGGSSKTHLRTHYSEKSFLCKEVIWINILELILVKSLFLVIKLFSNRCSETHLRTHYRENRFPCNQCPKVFSQESNLKKHLRTHTGKKLFPCNHCLKAFSQGGDMKRHLITLPIETHFPCINVLNHFQKKILWKAVSLQLM